LVGVFSKLIRFYPPFRKIQKKHAEFIEKLLQGEMQKIKEGTAGEGLLIRALRQKMEQGSRCEDLQKDQELKSLVLLLLAVDNLINVAVNFVPILHNNLSCAFSPALRNEIRKSEVIKGDGLDLSVLQDKEKMPLLDYLFQRSLAAKFTDEVPIIARYAEKEIRCGAHVVPPHTVIEITKPLEPLPDSRRVFSAGQRSCPARFVAEAIFKTLVIAAFHHSEPIAKLSSAS